MLIEETYTEFTTMLECFNNGGGTAVNKETALIYYQKAADRGDSDGQKALEEMNKLAAK